MLDIDCKPAVNAHQSGSSFRLYLLCISLNSMHKNRSRPSFAVVFYFRVLY